MKSLPPGLVAYKRTPEFDETSVPPGLLSAHTTKAGVWALIHVLEGELTYRILEPAPEEISLVPTLRGVVEPEVPHEVAPRGHVRFFVEFWRAANA